MTELLIIEMKSKENIFANYGEAIKDKEREKIMSACNL
jgi:hypothetical protein